MLYNCLITSILALLISHVARGQVLQWDPVLDCGPENSGAVRPRIALNAAGDPVVLWSRSSELDMFAAVGSDAGFGPAAQIDPAGVDIAAADWQGPAIDAAGDTVLVVFKALPEESAPCYLVRSTDGGHSWGDTMRVDPYDGMVSRFPSVAIANGGSAVVGYMQFTTGYLEPRQVVCAIMGDTFLPPAPVSAPFAPGDVCDCCTGEVTAADTRVLALYRNAGGNIRTIWGATSANGGASFTIGGELDASNWSLSACPSSGPDAYLAGDSVRYVWMSGAENGSKVFIGSAHAATLATGPQANVHPGQVSSLRQNFPRIAGQGDTLGVVWEQLYAGQREVLFAYSVTGPGGLGVPDTVNMELGGGQETPDIAFADGVFHIVWSEPSSGRVRYRRAQLMDDSGIAADGPLGMMGVRYDAVAEVVRVTGVQVRSARVMDAAGHELAAANGPVLSLLGAASGCYIVLVFTPDGLRHARRFIKQ